MMSEAVVSLPEFVAARDDPRMLVLDVRAVERRNAQPLFHPFVAVVHASRETLRSQVFRLATLVGGRHVIVVGDDEEDGCNAAALLRECEVDARALSGGMSSWREALLEMAAAGG